MDKNNFKEIDLKTNPFLTEKADELWRQLDKGGRPVSKEELLRRLNRNKNKK
jgi:hypothetical protein